MKAIKLTSTRQDILKTNADAAAMRLFVLLVLLLLSCSGVFGQEVKEAGIDNGIAIGNVTDRAADVKSESSNVNSQLELVKWFMGSGNPSLPQTSQKNVTAKKILINCGMTPNRILSRTLLKKAMQFENNIA